MDREIISYMKELTQSCAKSNYELDKKELKPLVVFAINACDELEATSEKLVQAEALTTQMKDYIAKVVKFLSAPDTVQPTAKDFTTFLLAKAKAFK